MRIYDGVPAIVVIHKYYLHGELGGEKTDIEEFPIGKGEAALKLYQHKIKIADPQWETVEMKIIFKINQ